MSRMRVMRNCVRAEGYRINKADDCRATRTRCPIAPGADRDFNLEDEIHVIDAHDYPLIAPAKHDIDQLAFEQVGLRRFDEPLTPRRQTDWDRSAHHRGELTG